MCCFGSLLSRSDHGPGSVMRDKNNSKGHSVIVGLLGWSGPGRGPDLMITLPKMCLGGGGEMEREGGKKTVW